MPNRELLGELQDAQNATSAWRFVCIILTFIILFVLMTPHDEKLAEKLGLYQAIDVGVEVRRMEARVEEETTKTSNLMVAIKNQQMRMDSIAENHNKLAAGVQSDMNSMRAAFRSFEQVMIEVHGTNAWTKAKRDVVERLIPKLKEDDRTPPPPPKGPQGVQGG